MLRSIGGYPRRKIKQKVNYIFSLICITNFIRHEKDIKKSLTTQGNKQYAGCYIYSRDEHDKTKKIGMSQAGLFRRIKSAGSCYPYKTEFWLQYIIISLDGHYTKGEKSTTIQIENALHNESKHLSTVKIQEEVVDPAGLTKEQGKRSREYRVLSSDTHLQTLLKRTLNKNLKKWDYLIVFSSNGWHILANDRTLAVPITSVVKRKPKKNANKKQTIYSLPLNRTMLAFPKGLKVGDVVPKSDNWDKFVVVEVISKKHVVARFPPSRKLYDIKL